MGKRKFTIEEVREYVNNTGCKLLSNIYDNQDTLLKIKCRTCGETFERSFKNFKKYKDYQCKKCSRKQVGEKNKKPYDEVKHIIESENNNKLITEEYFNNNQVLEIQCGCGEIFKRTLREFQSKKAYKCGKCSNHHNSSYEEVYNFILDKGCLLISIEYLNNSEKLKIQCKCGKTFERRYNNFKDSKQYYCSSCTSNSKGEIEIENYLNQYNIKYEQQKKFHDCKAIDVLPFDFFIKDKNILIEYDGKQHFLYGCFNGDLLDLMNIKYRDNIKNLYCKENNMQLIRIKYTDFNNIEKILKEILK